MSLNTLRIGLFSLCVLFSQLAAAQVREYHLNIDEKVVDVTGKPVKKILVNGQLPAPTLTFEEGDDAVIYVHNQLKNQASSLHWHGLLLPNVMDGVPGLGGFQEIQPNGTFVYRFKIRQNGTYWYHAHSQGQEQDGVYGAFIIYPKDRKPLALHENTQQDYVVTLSDFHPSSSQAIMANLKKSAEYYQNRRETIFDVMRQVQNTGVKTTWQDRKMWNQMRMLKTDLSDVTGYTFLMNGYTPTKNWIGEFNRGDKVRLRFINASAMSFFDVRIPNLKMTVVAADGQPVKPVVVDEFRFGASETYDVIVEPKDSNYQIQAESIDRSGFALGTLHQTTQPLVILPTPAHRPRALLNMADMGMAHDSHDMSKMNHDMGDMKGMDHDMSKMNHDMSDMKGMDHDMSKMNHDMGDMKGMDHDMSKMNHDMGDMKGMDHDMSKMNHDMSDTNTGETNATSPDGWANASTPKGLKMLQYQDLQSLTPQKDLRQPDQTIVMTLDGNMERYIWMLNGKKYNQATPLQVKYGERVRLTFVNNTMMAHPMHLHGMFVQLENGQPAQSMPNKHTVIVPPGKTVSVLLTADELGEWAIHCHLLYHMTSGMMNKLIVANTVESHPSASHSGHDMSSMQEISQPQSSSQGAHHAHH
ncbi:copper resistance system multicopper oxidase [Acinetobacter apis]